MHLRTVSREPLTYFLGVAAILYAINSVVSPAIDEDSSQTITVTRDELLLFMQYRANAFDTAGFSTILNSLPEGELEQITDDYVREEVLYREAKKLRLDQYDYTAKRRLVAQMEFLVRGWEEQSVAFEEGELEAYFSLNSMRYQQPAKVTFTHIFVAGQQSEHERQALGLLAEKNKQKAEFSSAIGQGDRFLYHTNYVRKDKEHVASHFGEDFTQALFSLPTRPSEWQGPLRSDYGWHVVLIAERHREAAPAFADVKMEVLEDASFEKLQQLFEQSVSSIVATYSVEIEEPLQVGEAL